MPNHAGGAEIMIKVGATALSSASRSCESQLSEGMTAASWATVLTLAGI